MEIIILVVLLFFEIMFNDETERDLWQVEKKELNREIKHLNVG